MGGKYARSLSYSPGLLGFSHGTESSGSYRVWCKEQESCSQGHFCGQKHLVNEGVERTARPVKLTGRPQVLGGSLNAQVTHPWCSSGSKTEFYLAQSKWLKKVWSQKKTLCRKWWRSARNPQQGFRVSLPDSPGHQNELRFRVACGHAHTYEDGQSPQATCSVRCCICHASRGTFQLLTQPPSRGSPGAETLHLNPHAICRQDINNSPAPSSLMVHFLCFEEQ